MKNKTNKTVKKRFRVTKNNKILYRTSGAGHFMAKRRNTRKNRNKNVKLLTNKKIIKKIRRSI